MNELIKMEAIGPENLDGVIALLHERNETAPAYTHWKYGDEHNGAFRGVVALRDGVAIGCFGLVVRDLVLPDGRTIPCGWFADWYVAQLARAGGLGTKLLNALSDACGIVLGHPGTGPSQKICQANGYRPLAFQSRRRLVLQAFEYERSRTHYWLKAAWKRVLSARIARRTRRQGRKALNQPFADAPLAQFANGAAHRDWILAQPTNLAITRTSGTFSGDGLEVVFIDDDLPHHVRRRRVLYCAGPRQFAVEAWRPFVAESRAKRCLYLEFFTTHRRLDAVWAALGATAYPDPAVMIRGGAELGDALWLHGWDRENWTYLAGNVDPKRKQLNATLTQTMRAVAK